MGGPLEGIKVIEMGVWVAAPAAGAILADWGADVIKIEPPGIGDPARMFQYTLGGDLPINPVFDNDNRSKRSIVADLRTPEGLQIALDLIAEADVFLSNVRPAGLARLGLGPEELMTRFPRLIYTSLTGYGNKGPEADRAAYDIAAFWSRSGIAHSLT
jgi:crotonobetainyl-CoA:carnitine CoA-transferase CaiB-like acyl-CoA transferase